MRAIGWYDSALGGPHIIKAHQTRRLGDGVDTPGEAVDTFHSIRSPAIAAIAPRAALRVWIELVFGSVCAITALI